MTSRIHARRSTWRPILAFIAGTVVVAGAWAGFRHDAWAGAVAAALFVPALAGWFFAYRRYAWAERARACGYPERFAQEALGHNSKAMHRAYAKHASVKIPSLDEFEGTPANGKILEQLLPKLDEHQLAKSAGPLTAHNANGVWLPVDLQGRNAVDRVAGANTVRGNHAGRRPNQNHSGTTA